MMNKKAGATPRNRLLLTIAFLLGLSCLALPPQPACAQLDEGLPSPIYSDYNTFLGMVNILELVAAGDVAVSGAVSAYRLDGALIARLPIFIEPGKQLDVIVNDLIGRQSDTYGVLVIDYNYLATDLEGRITYYRPNASGSSYSFSFSRALDRPLTGTTYAIGNSFDANGMGFLVPNWFQVVNLAPTAKSFTINLYDQAGMLLSTRSTTINQFERRDFSAGHDLGRGLFLVEVVPGDPAAEYSAAITRYGWNIVPGGTPRDFSYAISLDAKAGSTADVFSLTSNQRAGATNSTVCFRQSNWIELVNVASVPATFTASFFDSIGNPLSAQTISLPAKGQVHLSASNILEAAARGREFGVARVSTDTPQSILAQSTVYYQNCRDFRVQTVYATLLKTPTMSPIAGSYNRFLKMENNLLVVGTTAEARSIDFDLFFEGMPIFMEQFTLPIFGVVSRNLNDEDTFATMADSYGTISLDSSETATFLGYTLRTRKNADGVTLDFANLTSFR